MFVNPDKISAHGVNKAKIDSLLQQYQLLDASEGYARIHGMTVDAFMQHVESVGDNLAPVHHEDRERLLAEIASYIENGDDYFESEYRVERPERSLPIWRPVPQVSRFRTAWFTARLSRC